MVFPREKTLAYCASSYRAWQTSGSILLGCARSSINYCASHNIISVTPKRLLKQKFLKKVYSSNGKTFRPSFSLIIQFDKPQEKTYKGPQGTLKNIVQVIRSFV